MVVEETVSVPP